MTITTTNKVLIVLLLMQLAWLGAEHLWREEPYRPPRPVTGASLFPAVTAERVTELKLVNAGRLTDLKRSADGFVVASENDVAADAYFVEVALQSLAQMAPGSIVSENPERHAAYEVIDPYGVEVTALDEHGIELAHFVVGRGTPDGRAFYIRFPFDGTDVMLIRRNVRDAFDRYGNGPGAWRDKTLFKAESRAIERIEITNRDERIEIKRVVPSAGATSDQDDWVGTRPTVGTVERMVGNAMTSNLADLRADQFHDGDLTATELGLEPPRVRIDAHLADGTTLSLEVGNEVNNRLYVRRPGDAEIAMVPVFKLHNFLRSSGELIKH